MPREATQEYIVLSKKQETKAVTTLVLTLSSGNIPLYKAGQYITVYFSDSSTPRGKEYSISSSPTENVFTITVKAIGEYSNRLCTLQCGDTFLGSLPRGSFYSEHDDLDFVLLAAGIGITPLRSMILNAAQKTPARELYLFYSNATVQENLFMHEFETLAKKNEKFHIQSFVTRESVTTPMALVRRITPEKISRTIRNGVYSEFLISGTTSFVREQRTGLENAGFLSEQIHTEVCS